MPAAKPPRKDITKLQYKQQQLSVMRTERESFLEQWQQLSRFIQPRRGRYFVSDVNKGDRRWNNIINSVATLSLRTARNGMFAGICSPSRPWFRMETANRDLMEFAPVKEWCYKTTNIIAKIFQDSNFYNMVPTLIGETLLFGTGFMTQEDDYDDVARFFTHTIGSYYLAQDGAYRVNRAARELQMTTDQMVGKFGYDNCSQDVKTAYDNGDYHNWYNVVQFIEKNGANYNPKALQSSRNMKFVSCYYQPDRCGDPGAAYLEEKGFPMFPGYGLRWDVTGEDIYGTDCPAMMALGDTKGLQTQERRKAQGIDKMVSPPMGGPPSLRNVNVSGLPGGLTVYDASGNGQKLEALYNVKLSLQELRQDMDAVEARIKSAFFYDLFLPITGMEGVQPQNQLTITSRNQEALLQLGPVLERFHNELLGPAIDRTFAQAVAAKILPPIPQELSGAPLKISYISTLAMAQRADTLGDMDRLVTFVGGVVKSGWGDALDKIDADQMVDEYAMNLGTPPSLIVSDEAVAQKRQVRAQQEQQAQQLQMAQMAAQGVNTLANSPTDKPNALTDISGATSGNG